MKNTTRGTKPRLFIITNITHHTHRNNKPGMTISTPIPPTPYNLPTTYNPPTTTRYSNHPSIYLSLSPFPDALSIYPNTTYGGRHSWGPAGVR